MTIRRIPHKKFGGTTEGSLRVLTDVVGEALDELEHDGVKQGTPRDTAMRGAYSKLAAGDYKLLTISERNAIYNAVENINPYEPKSIADPEVYRRWDAARRQAAMLGIHTEFAKED